MRKLANLTRSVDDASSRSASRDASVMTDGRTEYRSLVALEVPADRLWAAQTLEHFSIGQDLMPFEIIPAYAILKRSGAIANHKGGRLDDRAYEIVVKVRDELLDGQQRDAAQHKRQRGDLKPRLPDRPHVPRQQGSGASRRSGCFAAPSCGLLTRNGKQP